MFRDGDAADTSAARTALAAQKTATSRQYVDVRSSPDSWKTNAVRNYAEARPFAGEGRSQSQLKKQDRPLTLEEVRELLNKNK